MDDLDLVVADDDFIEHLHENSFLETIDIAELDEQWNEWAAENIE